MPDDLKRAMVDHVTAEVAEPLAADVRASAYGPYGPRVTVRVAKGVEPALRAGGARKAFSGGASGAQVFYGNEFGGGRSRTWYVTSSRTGHRYSVHRATTRQFRRPPRPFVLSTFAAERDDITERWGQVLDPFLDAWAAGGE